MANTILINEEFSDEIFNQCKSAKEEVTIYCAFIKRQTIERIGNSIDPSVRVSIIARWRVGDLLAGVSDLSVYDYCKVKNWTFGIKLSLHAKVFIFDNSTVLLGSANATESGFGLARNSNDEVSAVFAPEIKDLKRLRALEAGVTWLDQALFENLSNFIDQCANQKIDVDTYEWPKPIMEKISNSAIWALWISELPQVSFETAVGSGWSHTELANEFQRSNVFRWLLQILKNADSDYTNFGWLTNELHNVLLDEPRPYRKEVKDYVVILFDWIKNSGISEVYIKKHARTSSLHFR